MKKKKLLLLGGSAQQVPAIERAREEGYTTILIDYLPENPGQYVADRWYPGSTTDIETVYSIAKEEAVDGILAYASDPAAIPAAVVSERLGLPTNPADSVKILGEKHRFRKFLKDNGFNTPNFISFPKEQISETKKEEIGRLKFPLVIKPTDSSGSKGISVIRDKNGLDEAIEYALNYSRNGQLIAEEFIFRSHPEIIGGDILVIDGEIKILGLMTAIRGDDGVSVIPIGESFPDNLNPEIREKIKEELNRLLTILKIRNGEFNIEIMIGENNGVYFLEVGPRAGGNMIPIQLSDVFSADLIRANVKIAMGEKTEIKSKENPGNFVTYVLHSRKEGVFEGVKMEQGLKKYLYREVLYKKPGEKIEKFDGAGKAVGILFFHFPEAIDLKKLENKISVITVNPSDI